MTQNEYEQLTLYRGVLLEILKEFRENTSIGTVLTNIESRIKHFKETQE